MTCISREMFVQRKHIGAAFSTYSKYLYSLFWDLNLQFELAAHNAHVKMTIKAFKPWLLKSKLDGLGTLSTSVSTRMCKSLVQFRNTAAVLGKLKSVSIYVFVYYPTLRTDICLKFKTWLKKQVTDGCSYVSNIILKTKGMRTASIESEKQRKETETLHLT